jgi:hypothetical protein
MTDQLVRSDPNSSLSAILMQKAEGLQSNLERVQDIDTAKSRCIPIRRSQGDAFQCNQANAHFVVLETLIQRHGWLQPLRSPEHRAGQRSGNVASLVSKRLEITPDILAFSVSRYQGSIEPMTLAFRADTSFPLFSRSIARGSVVQRASISFRVLKA